MEVIWGGSVQESNKQILEVTAEWTNLVGFIGNAGSITEWLLHETSWVPHVSLQRGNLKRSKLYHNYYYDFSLLVLPKIKCAKMFTRTHRNHGSKSLRLRNISENSLFCMTSRKSSVSIKAWFSKVITFTHSQIEMPQLNFVFLPPMWLQDFTCLIELLPNC